MPMGSVLGPYPNDFATISWSERALPQQHDLLLVTPELDLALVPVSCRDDSSGPRTQESLSPRDTLSHAWLFA